MYNIFHRYLALFALLVVLVGCTAPVAGSRETRDTRSPLEKDVDVRVEAIDADMDDRGRQFKELRGEMERFSKRLQELLPDKESKRAVQEVIEILLQQMKIQQEMALIHRLDKEGYQEQSALYSKLADDDEEKAEKYRGYVRQSYLDSAKAARSLSLTAKATAMINGRYEQNAVDEIAELKKLRWQLRVQVKEMD